MPSPITEDFGFKIGDQVSAKHTIASTEYVGMVTWHTVWGMTLETLDNRGYSLRWLVDHGYELTLIERPVLSHGQERLADALDNPDKQFAWRDNVDPTSCTIITELAMGQPFPVIVMHTSVRDAFVAGAPFPVVEYGGRLPTDD
jgi:hypothetical protein